MLKSDKEKKILHVFTVPFSINYFVGEQFKYFNKKNTNSYYVSCASSEELYDLAKKNSFNPLPIDISREIKPFQDLKAIFQLYKHIKNNKIDGVVGHTPKGGMVAMIAAALAGIQNRIYFRHGIFYETSKGIKRLLLRNIDRLSGNLAKKVVCVSNDVRNISVKDKLNKKDKNIILGRGTCNGVDSEKRFNPSFYSEKHSVELRKKIGLANNDLVVGFVGRIVKDKGINELVGAWKKINSTHKNAKLLLIGPIEKKDSVSAETLAEIENNNTIITTGNVGDVAPFYTVMDIFILPTYREGFPTVVLEASSMELPIIITEATGCKEAILNGKTGIFTKNNPEDISEKISYYLSNPEVRTLHGQNGRKFISENFEQTKIWNLISDNLHI